MNKSMHEIHKEAEALPKPAGWEVKGITEANYKPEPHWEPFAVTASSTMGTRFATIWVKREITKV